MHPSREQLLSIASIIAIILAFFLTITAYAHEIEPLTYSPKLGEVLQQSPGQVRLTFEEELAEQGSGLQVFDTQGKQVDLGGGGVDLDDPQHAALVVGLPELPEGAYLIKWQVTLLDGDASQGQYYFGVGDVVLPQAAPAEPETETNPAPAAQTRASVTVCGVPIASLALVAAFAIFWVKKAPPKP